MNSSGIKRGLAATAVSALAVAGLPFLASTASATPIADTFAPDAVDMYVPEGAAGISAKNDGTNTTVSLVAGGGSNVTNILYQYSIDAGVTWVNVPGGNVARNADGVFQTEWASPPATVTNVRAVPNTGEVNADSETAVTIPDATADTMELATEGALGVFQEPYTEGPQAGTASELVGVTGTVSDGTAAVTVWDASHGTANNTAMTVDPATDTFQGMVDILGYPYSPGVDPNQIALAGFTAPDITNDAEGSTLYVQTIGSITATPATQEDVTPADSTAVLTVLDTTGQPVAGAQVFRGGDSDTDGGGADTDVDGAEELVGYTDGNGQIVADPAFGPEAGPGAAGTETYYVNTTDTDAYEAGTDPSTNVTVTTYVPVLATVDIVNERSRADFDLDELMDSDADDFTIETRDQQGNLYDETIVGNDVEYRWVVDADAVGVATETSAWLGDAYLVDNADGTYTVDELTDADWNDNAQFPTATSADLPIGTYTLEARRPNVAGVGLTNATPETFRAGESEVYFDEGNNANATVNENFTVDGELLNDDGTPLAGRKIELYWTPGGDAVVAPQSAQPSGTTFFNSTYAEATTDAQGGFSVVLSDPDIPDNVEPTEESGTLQAYAVEAPDQSWYLWDNNGPDDPGPNNAPANAAADLTVNFIVQPDADEIILDIETIAPTYEFGGADGGPGVPIDIDVEVEDAANNTLSDYPVTVTIDEGFLSDDAENATQLNLADGHDSAGDLYGFFEDLGQTQDFSTGDSGFDGGIVAAIEDNAGFDDDGRVTSVITVTAGDVSVTETVLWDVNWLLNIDAIDLDPAPGEPSGQVPVTEDVMFELHVFDQFGNLAGDTWADINDDSTVADFETDEDADETQSDFTVDGPGIRAFSAAPATQTLFAEFDNEAETTVVAEGAYPNWVNATYVGESDPIEWVAAPAPANPNLVLQGRNNGARDDRLKANADSVASGAIVKFFRKKANGNWKLVAEGVLNAKGNKKVIVSDLNGKRKTKYKAVVQATDDTRRASDTKRVR